MAMKREWGDWPARSGSSIDSAIAVDMIGVYMDESDWKFVIDCLRYRTRTSPASSDTAERAEFTADSIQDVLSSL